MLRFTGLFTPARVKQWEKQRSKGMLFNIVYMGIILRIIPFYIFLNLLEWATGQAPLIYHTKGADIAIWVAFGLLFGALAWYRRERRYAQWLEDHPDGEDDRRLDTSMSPRQMKAWEKTRAKGSLYFILVYGVLFWGLLSGALFFVMVKFLLMPPGQNLHLIGMIVWPVGGLFFGAFMWWFNERYYKKALQAAGGQQDAATS